jgi:enoyl-[acyl-carrier protein] reductase I
MTEVRPILTGHKSLIVGIANDQSIAYGCAEAFRWGRTSRSPG